MALRLSWWVKTLEQKKATFRELRGSRVGRRVRLLGTVETIAPGTVPPRVELPKPRHSALTDPQFKTLRGHEDRGILRQLLDCDSPLALWRISNVPNHENGA